MGSQVAIEAVQHVKRMRGGKSGAEKKEAALSFATSAISMTDAVMNKQIVDPDKFRDGLGKIIDGVVQCLNASAWAKN